MENQISISKAEYKYLLTNSLKYGMLLDSLYQLEELNWDKESLAIDTKQINNILKIIDEERYKRKINELLEKETKENE